MGEGGGGGHTVGIAVYEFAWEKKKKKKIELPTWLLRLLFSFVTYRPGFIYFLCNEMPRYQWRRGRERPLSIVRLWRKFEITAPRKRGYSPLLYRKMAARAFESFDNFHRSGIRDRYIYIYVCMYIYIYIFFFSSFSFIIPLSLVRTRFQRDLAVKMFVNIYIIFSKRSLWRNHYTYMYMKRVIDIEIQVQLCINFSKFIPEWE